MSNLVRFEKVDNELNILRIGGKSFLPPDVEWPTNPNGDRKSTRLNSSHPSSSRMPSSA